MECKHTQNRAKAFADNRFIPAHQRDIGPRDWSPHARAGTAAMAHELAAAEAELAAQLQQNREALAGLQEALQLDPGSDELKAV